MNPPRGKIQTPTIGFVKKAEYAGNESTNTITF
jgi:hypothetical protein